MPLSADRPALPPTAELFERYGAMVYRRCRAILGDDSARDAVQEVFMRVVEKRQLFRGDSSPSTWLYTIATLHCLQRLRDHHGHAAKLQQLAAVPELSGASPEDRLTLVRLLAQQPEEVRLMVYLRYADGATMEEVAEIVGYSRKTVSQRLQEFLASAQERLLAEGGLP
jgi:RNA polymerase sigma-70 factor (ECF subfamily)